MIKRFYHQEGGKTVSSLVFYDIMLPSRYLGVIEEVYTDPEYRGNGFAKALIFDAMLWAKELGVDCIELTCKKELEGFYKKLGFKDRENKSFRFNVLYDNRSDSPGI